MRIPRALVVAGFLFTAQYVTIAVAQQQTSTAADTGWTLDQPLTGRAMPCKDGRIKSFECQNVELLSYLPRSTLGGEVGFDVWGWTDSTTGREFTILGGLSGTAFVEVTDPVNPKYLGVLPLREGATGIGPTAESVKVYQHYAFIGYEWLTHGIQIFDLTQLLRDVKSPTTFEATAYYDGLGRTHTIALNQATGFAYANGGDTCGGGLHAIDVHTPTKPVFAGCYTNRHVGAGAGGVGQPGAVHDAQCVLYHGPDGRYKGREICLNAAGSGVDIVDVTDKQQPKSISIATYPNVGYAHQGWLTEDQQYFFLDDEFDDGAGGINKTRTIGFDLNRLDDPVVLTEFYGTTDATDHNLYIRGKYMYQSNYTAGLRIIDIGDPKHPKEVGFLDTTPDKSGVGMMGQFGNYPFFKNDVVATSDDHGLFLVRLRSR